LGRATPQITNGNIFGDLAQIDCFVFGLMAGSLIFDCLLKKKNQLNGWIGAGMNVWA
jgi:hypothetical protein